MSSCALLRHVFSFPLALEPGGVLWNVAFSCWWVNWCSFLYCQARKAWLVIIYWFIFCRLQCCDAMTTWARILGVIVASQRHTWQGHSEVLSEGQAVMLAELHLITITNGAFQRTQTSTQSDFHSLQGWSLSVGHEWRLKTCSHAIVQYPGRTSMIIYSICKMFILWRDLKQTEPIFTENGSQIFCLFPRHYCSLIYLLFSGAKCRQAN